MNQSQHKVKKKTNTSIRKITQIFAFQVIKVTQNFADQFEECLYQNGCLNGGSVKFLACIKEKCQVSKFCRPSPTFSSESNEQFDSKRKTVAKCIQGKLVIKI